MSVPAMVFVVGAALFVAGLTTVLFGPKGDVVGKVEGRLRYVMITVGLVLAAVGVYLDDRARPEKELERLFADHAAKETRSSRAITRYLTSCAIRILEFPTRYPAIAGWPGKDLNVALPRNNDLDLLGWLKTQVKDNTKRIRWASAPPGSGKSAAIEAVHYEYCKAALNGDLDSIVVIKDARKDDLHKPEAREALGKYLEDLALALPSSKVTLVVDSLDELLVQAPPHATDLYQQIESWKPKFNEVVVARKHAFTDLDRDAHPAHFGSDEEYRLLCLRSLVFKRVAGPNAHSQSTAEERHQVLEHKEGLNKGIEDEMKALKEWLAKKDLWNEHMGYRALQIAINARYKNVEERGLGSLYRHYVLERIKSDLGDLLPSNLASETLLDCASLELICSRDGKKTDEPCPVRTSVCRESRKLLEAASLLPEQADGVTQDVVAVNGLAFSDCVMLGKLGEVLKDPHKQLLAKTTEKLKFSCFPELARRP